MAEMIDLESDKKENIIFSLFRRFRGALASLVGQKSQKPKTDIDIILEINDQIDLIKAIVEGPLKNQLLLIHSKDYDEHTKIEKLCSNFIFTTEALRLLLKIHIQESILSKQDVSDEELKYLSELISKEFVRAFDLSYGDKTGVKKLLNDYSKTFIVNLEFEGVKQVTSFTNMSKQLDTFIINLRMHLENVYHIFENINRIRYHTSLFDTEKRDKINLEFKALNHTFSSISEYILFLQSIFERLVENQKIFHELVLVFVRNIKTKRLEYEIYLDTPDLRLKQKKFNEYDTEIKRLLNTFDTEFMETNDIFREELEELFAYYNKEYPLYLQQDYEQLVIPLKNRPFVKVQPHYVEAYKKRHNLN